LYNSGKLVAKQNILFIGQYLVSDNGKYLFTLDKKDNKDGNYTFKIYYQKKDGSLVNVPIKNNPPVPAGFSIYTVKMEDDGSVNLFNKDFTNFTLVTKDKNASYLKMQDDGNFVIYSSDGSVIYATNTNGDLPGDATVIDKKPLSVQSSFVIVRDDQSQSRFKLKVQCNGQSTSNGYIKVCEDCDQNLFFGYTIDVDQASTFSFQDKSPGVFYILYESVKPGSSKTFDLKRVDKPTGFMTLQEFKDEKDVTLFQFSNYNGKIKEDNIQYLSSGESLPYKLVFNTTDIVQYSISGSLGTLHLIKSCNKCADAGIIDLCDNRPFGKTFRNLPSNSKKDYVIGPDVGDWSCDNITKDTPTVQFEGETELYILEENTNPVVSINTGTIAFNQFSFYPNQVGNNFITNSVNNDNEIMTKSVPFRIGNFYLNKLFSVTDDLNLILKETEASDFRIRESIVIGYFNIWYTKDGKNYFWYYDGNSPQITLKEWDENNSIPYNFTFYQKVGQDIDVNYPKHLEYM